MLRRSALRADCTALLGPRSRRETRSVRCALCAQTVAASQLTKRSLRSRRPRPCAARRRRNRRRRVPPAATSTTWGLRQACHDVGGKGSAGRAAARMGGAEKRRARGRARTRALRQLTRRICLSAESAANEASYATGHETEHRRGVGARRRPPRISAAACPAGPLLALIFARQSSSATEGRNGHDPALRPRPRQVLRRQPRC
jgi:hypothetical protein